MSVDVCPSALSGFPADLFLSLLNTLMVSKCMLDTKDKYPQDFGPLISNGDEFDFIIIGSGSAGSVVAHELAKNSDWNILVLEAGTVPSVKSEVPGLLFNVQKTDEDWQYTVEKDPNACLSFKDQKCRWPRGKVLGGCSALNGMLYIRGNKRDYDQWGQIAEGWDYESVLPHFKKIENYQDPNSNSPFGTEGQLPLFKYDTEEPIWDVLKEAARELGIPNYTYESNIGYFSSLFTANGTRLNTAKVFLKTKQNNLRVSQNSFVEKLIIDPVTKLVTGVKVQVGDRKLSIKAKKEIIVSAGSINSPQILLLSGIGPKEHLKSMGIPAIVNLPVGQNLQDHMIYWGFQVKFDKSYKKSESLADELYKYFVHQKGKFSEVNLLGEMGFINTRNDSLYANIQYHHFVIEPNDTSLKQIYDVIGFNDEFSKSVLAANENDALLTIIPTLLNPKSRGEILLRTDNPYDKPLIRANYFQDPDDLEVMLEGIKFVEKLTETKSFQKLKPDILDPGLGACTRYALRSDDYWRCYLRNIATTVYHPVGTCSLDLVVDPRLRVKGIKNLRVMDASIMPIVTSGNTQAPTMMIGAKGASMVHADWDFNQDEL